MIVKNSNLSWYEWNSKYPFIESKYSKETIEHKIELYKTGNISSDLTDQRSGCRKAFRVGT